MPSHMLSALLLIAAFGFAGCTSLQLDGRSATALVWATEGDSPHRANAVETRIEPPLREVWSFNAGAGFGAVSPLIVDDVALIGTRKGEIHAIELDSGRRLGQSDFGEAIDGTPVVSDGVLYTPISWGGYALHAYDLRRGSTLWRVKGAPIDAGLLMGGDVVIAADVEGWVRAYGVRDGEVRWETELGQAVGVKASPALVNGHLIVGDDRGRVTALSSDDGSIVWQADVGAPVYAALAGYSDVVFVPTTRSRLIALNALTGEILWTHTLPSEEVYVASPAVGSHELVFGASDGQVRALDRADGSVLWTTEVDGAVTVAPLLSANTVYVGTMRSKLIGLGRSDGAHRWETKLAGRIKSPFASSGTQVVVLAEPRHVYLFDVDRENYATRED